jgi:hypothetical protein
MHLRTVRVTSATTARIGVDAGSTSIQTCPLSSEVPYGVSGILVRAEEQKDSPFAESAVVVSHAADPSTIEIAVHGQWGRDLRHKVYTAIHKCLAEHPSAIIVDLHGLRDIDCGSASMWLAASQAAASLHPPAQLVLCLPPTRRLVNKLRRLGSARFLSLFATKQQARAAVDRRLPLTDRVQLGRLPADASSVDAACELIAIACKAWALPQHAAAAQALISDLVSDSVEHARTDMMVIACRRNIDLYLAVRDYDFRLPPVRRAGDRSSAESEARRLSVVRAEAFIYGAMPTADGKTVWALLRIGPSARR